MHDKTLFNNIIWSDKIVMEDVQDSSRQTWQCDFWKSFFSAPAELFLQNTPPATPDVSNKPFMQDSSPFYLRMPPRSTSHDQVSFFECTDRNINNKHNKQNTKEKANKVKWSNIEFTNKWQSIVDQQAVRYTKEANTNLKANDNKHNIHQQDIVQLPGNTEHWTQWSWNNAEIEECRLSVGKSCVQASLLTPLEREHVLHFSQQHRPPKRLPNPSMESMEGRTGRIVSRSQYSAEELAKRQFLQQHKYEVTNNNNNNNTGHTKTTSYSIHNQSKILCTGQLGDSLRPAANPLTTRQGEGLVLAFGSQEDEYRGTSSTAVPSPTAQWRENRGVQTPCRVSPGGRAETEDCSRHMHDYNKPTNTDIKKHHIDNTYTYTSVEVAPEMGGQLNTAQKSLSSFAEGSPAVPAAKYSFKAEAQTSFSSLAEGSQEVPTPRSSTEEANIKASTNLNNDTNSKRIKHKLQMYRKADEKEKYKQFNNIKNTTNMIIKTSH